MAAVVLSQVHVSCFITAANRATPVFEVVPDRCCVRVVNKPPGEHSSAAATASSSSSPSSLSSASVSAATPSSVEWDFHTLFSSTSLTYASDFYREVTLPAFRNACDGWNTNIVALGVHPTQKYRLLFGKSTGVNTTTSSSFPASSSDVDSGLQYHENSEKEILELYGQVGGLLHEIFAAPRASTLSTARLPQTHLATKAALGWRVGISSWIVVHNQAIDLLKSARSPPPPKADGARKSTSMPGSSPAPLSFVSLEAKSFASACRILQTAKTNRIVTKQNAEHAHFFLRLALFRDGQVSTIHLVDLVDLKDFKDPVAVQEKQELFEILHELRQPPMSPRLSMASPARTPDRGVAAPGTPKYKSRHMTLSNFVLPLLTANAKTFLHANVIDSRASLRESVQLLNAVANVKGFACACKRLCGVEFAQLGFQPLPDDLLRQNGAGEGGSQHPPSLQDAATKAMAAVTIGESLLSRLASSASVSLGSIASSSSLPSSSLSFSMPAPLPFTTPDLSSILASDSSTLSLSSFSNSEPIRQQLAGVVSARRDSFSAVPMESETLAWLEAFSQRKREILGGKIDTIVPLSTRPLRPQGHDMGTYTAATESAILDLDRRVVGGGKSGAGVGDSGEYDSLSRSSGGSETGSLHAATHSHTATVSRVMPVRTNADLFDKLRGVMKSDERSAIHRSSSEPLPIMDDEDEVAAYTAGHDGNTSTLSYLAARSPESLRDRSRVQFRGDDGESWPLAPTPLSSQSRHADQAQHTRYPAIDSVYEATSSTARPAPRAPPADPSSTSCPSRVEVQGEEAPHKPSSPEPSSSSSPSSAVMASQHPPASASKYLGSSTPTRSLSLQHRQEQLHETLERANVPLKATAPANLEGLDPVTVTKIQATEAALLRKNYDALLTIVQEQQQLREAAEAKAAEAAHDLDEVRASFEVQLENLKLLNVSLRSKVRALETHSALPKVFEQYDQELHALLTEVQQLRGRNVALELKVRALLLLRC